jgi:hypothetical protein
VTNQHDDMHTNHDRRGESDRPASSDLGASNRHTDHDRAPKALGGFVPAFYGKLPRF